MPSKGPLIQPIKRFRYTQNSSFQALRKTGTINKKLKRLRINFPDSGNIYLKSITSNLRYIERVTIVFLDCNPKDKAKAKILVEVFKKFSRLNHLDFDFGWCDRISTRSLLLMKPILSKLYNLTRLELNFEWCSNISDSSMRSVLKSLTKLRGLKSLGIKLNGCDKISNKAVLYVSSTLAYLKKLKQVYLELKKCDKITDEGLRNLFYAGLKIKTLECIILDFEERQKIVYLSLKEIQKRIERIHDLEQVHIETLEHLTAYELFLELPCVEEIWIIPEFLQKMMQNMKEPFERNYRNRTRKIAHSQRKAIENQVFYISL